jgi:hypothetical protein
MELMRRCVVLAIAGCSFDAPASPVVDGAPEVVDVAVDTAPARLCAPDPALRMCFSFDGPLPATLPNEGTAAVDATLTDITQIVRSADSGAAQFGATSSVVLPMTPDISSILSIEVWFRVDTMPANGGRGGLVDSNVSPPNISLFFNRVDPGTTLRCGLGGQTEVFDATVVTGAWLYAACTCDGTNLVMYLDGIKLGERAGTCGSAGALVDDGLTIGSDNTGDPSAVGDRIAGAIDGIRLWSTGLTPTQVCERAGLAGC